MKKLSYLVVLILILGLVLTGCFLSNVGQVPATDQSGITYSTKGVPLSDDLVGLWHFSDNLTDSSSNDNGGTVDGETEYVDSPMGRAFSFNGSTCVYVDDSDSLDITRATLEAWVRPSVSSSQVYARIVFKGTNSPFVPLYFLAYDGSGTHMRMVVYINGVAKSATSTTTLTDPTKWYHIAGTYDGTDVKIYVDGALEGTTNVLGDGEIDAGSEALGIGRNPEANKYGYNGLIDEVRIWKVALSEGQLRFIYDFDGILPPIKADGSSVFKLGRTIPVKFQLRDDQGNFVTNAVANIFLQKFDNGDPEGDPMEGDSTSAASTGTEFRYDFTSNQYIFNLATKLLSTGTWQIRILLDDGMSYYVKIGLK